MTSEAGEDPLDDVVVSAEPPILLQRYPKVKKKYCWSMSYQLLLRLFDNFCYKIQSCLPFYVWNVPLHLTCLYEHFS